MLFVYNKKVEVEFKKEDELVLDGQSRILNWLYNQLLTLCVDDYQNNENRNKFLDNRNLRNYVTRVMKKEHPFLNTVFSSPVKEVSGRLKDAYSRLFTGQNQYPKYRSWKKKWYSLFFDESNKGWEVKGNQLTVMLGNIPNLSKIKGKKNPGVYGTLKETFTLQENEKINDFRLCKQQGGKFYAIFNIERSNEEDKVFKESFKQYQNDIKSYNILKKKAKTKEEKQALPQKPVLPKQKIKLPKDASWISLDPNHKNFFVGVDNQGNSIEWNKLGLIKYWDKKIDKLKSKRDKCEKNYRKRKTIHGNMYTIHSPRWNRLNKALNKAYHCHREQIKTMMYTIANELYRRYDVVIIGDYTPTNGTAPFDNMKRSMLNQEVIGQFRDVLEWVASKREKMFMIANEHNTTKECCVCGHQEKKDPSTREFTCISCGTTLMRDNNSAVNIGKKKGFVLNKTFFLKLSSFTFQGVVPVGGKAIIQ